MVMFDKTFVLANTAARSTVAYGLPDSVIFGDKWRENFSAIWREWTVPTALHDAFSG
ncbi:hypothetical protein G3A43_41340 [Paraburkholderia aspalathi]|uniref:hypothetical protein n=1 Tax=Paraburkholderia nemoris TaxID=2793076 RepID=UPI00190ACAEF|nr:MULTISPECIES: hypothetical protein [Paraburkholderia]MBK3786641.1 hypothetical protein [Paraburkholderia aspalathi]